MEEELSARMRILEMIDSGKITAEEGLRLLQAISGTEEETPQNVPDEAAPLAPTTALLIEEDEIFSEAGIIDEAPAMPVMESATEAPAASQPEAPRQQTLGKAEVIYQPSPEKPSLETEKWRHWWTIPLWIGVGVTVIGALFMYWASQSVGPASFWFFCASLPFALGVVVIVMAFYSRTWPWLHLRVQQAPGETPQRIAISMPIPVRPLAWAMRIAGNWVPEIREHNVAEILTAVGSNTSADNPIFIQVDDEDGEKVEIYIG
jgi:hypothetical protein